MANILREITEDGVAVLTFDRPNSAANIFDRATLVELGEHLEVIAGDSKISGVVFLSAKPAIFIAGADLKALAHFSEGDLRDFIELGQTVFSKVAALKIPTVAAIHGACVGGGYEFCLACDYRIATPERATKIGLPETKLGILPAWGGSTRLPRLIGVPRALDIILGGKTPAAPQALRLGMINDLVPRENLRRAAAQWMAKGVTWRRRSLLVRLPFLNAAIGHIIAPRVRARVLRETRGHYPALLKALEVITAGAAAWNENESFEREREAVLELAETPECRNLLQVFQLQERAKKLSFAADVEVAPIQQVAVIGAGVMGAAIAHWLSSRGVRVILRDLDAGRVAAGMARLARLYENGVKHHVLNKREMRDGLDRISPAASEVPLGRVDLVIEAAVEKLELKKEIFAHIDQLRGAETLLATNTSALSLAEIAGATRDPSRVVGLHFFNPVHRMPLIEVVIGPETSREAVQRAVNFTQRIGKLPVIVRDSPGFLVNRILLPYLVEAAHFFAIGAKAVDVDKAMLDFGMPMGPLRLIDEVGLDVAAEVAATLAAKFPDRMRLPAVLARMIEAGWLGRKKGRGFYAYRNGEEPAANALAAKFQENREALSRLEMQRRMALLMVNEAARCLEEKVVGTAADVDFGMIMGAGFAPFRGGPLRFADASGLARICSELTHLAEVAGAPFAPCELLKTMAAANQRFYEN